MDFKLTFFFFFALLKLTLQQSHYSTVNPVSQTQAKCLYNNMPSYPDVNPLKKYPSLIFRVMSQGNLDNVGLQNIKNAMDAGWGVIADHMMLEVYMSPCISTTPGCSTPYDQMTLIVNALSSYLSDDLYQNKIQRVWLDANSPYLWTNDINYNRKIMWDFMNAANRNYSDIFFGNTYFGVYTSEDKYNQIFGNYTNVIAANTAGMWWADSDGRSDCDCACFGYFDTATYKQYQLNTNLCGVTIELSSTCSYYDGQCSSCPFCC